MSKTTYIGVASNGETFSRQTARTYTHAVVAISTKTGKIGSYGVTFCGNLDLAKKALRKGVDGYSPEQCELVEVKAK